MIKVYTTETCYYCHALMDWLDKEGVEYKELNAANADFPIEAVPVTVIGDQKIIGFDRVAIKKALREAEEDQHEQAA